MLGVQVTNDSIVLDPSGTPRSVDECGNEHPIYAVGSAGGVMVG